MSVLLETSVGDIVIDLEVQACPKTCENFLKLCKMYYYNLNAFFNVSKDFLAQSGDPSATGTGGESIWSLLSSSSSDVPRYFPPEIVPRFKHTEKGTVSMAVAPALEGHSKGGCGSQFFITLGDNIDYLDGKHAVFGHVVEGLDTLDKLNDIFTDADGRPLKDVRIRHVIVLEDPFPDPPGLAKPPSSPTRPPDNSTRIAEDEDPLSTLPEEEEERIRREKAAAASALTLEMVGDLPFANVRPPENVLFVCKLNPVTRDEDLELIFSRFGTIMSCQVIRDKRTGDSLQYAFIEFDKREDAEQAYFKMQNVLVDDRRIWVDFSQSVARLNNVWSNEPKRVKKSIGKTNAGGFGGRDDLEQTRRYRESDGDGRRGNGDGANAARVERRNARGTKGDVPGRLPEIDTTAGTSGEAGVEIVTGVTAGGDRRAAQGGICRSAVLSVIGVSTIVALYFCHPLNYISLLCITLPTIHPAMLSSSYEFNALDADVVLISSEPEPAEFRVHKSILAVASPFFCDMFSLPQPSHNTKLPLVPVSETRPTLDALLRYIYPIPDPNITSLDQLVPVLGAAVKYDFETVIATLRKLLVSPEFLQAAPTQVFAIASRFDLEDEARLASRYTLSVNILDSPLSDDLKHITAYSYHRLLNLHRKRASSALGLLQVRSEVKCMQCNVSSYGFAPPKWWNEFEKRAKEELAVRPTTDVIFGLGFLARVASASGCQRCPGSLLDSYLFLDELKKKIDELPATI